MRSFLIAAALIVLGLAISACDSANSGATARLTVRMTDAPFPFDLAESADVTITRIELLAAEDDGDTSNAEPVSGRIVLYDGAPISLNLLDLRDGVDTLLVGGVSIPSDGSYNRLRVFVDEDASVTFTDGTVYDLKLPSAQQSGIKIALPVYDASEGEAIDVLLDFDVEQSFVARGNPASPGFQGFLFKPVVEVESFQIVRDTTSADTTSTTG